MLLLLSEKWNIGENVDRLPKLLVILFHQFKTSHDQTDSCIFAINMLHLLHVLKRLKAQKTTQRQQMTVCTDLYDNIDTVITPYDLIYLGTEFFSISQTI